MNKKLTTALVAAAFIIGGGVSAATSQAEPTTPASCITALRLADEVFTVDSVKLQAETAAVKQWNLDGDLNAYWTSVSAAGSSAGQELDRIGPMQIAAKTACRAGK